VSLDGVTLRAPDGRPLLRNVGFAVSAGDCLAIVGASGAGKSTLCRVLTGLALPDAGTARLDGATLDQYPQDELGRAVGYLPQEPMLFAATVAQNIARMQQDAPADAIVAAARLAGAHDMILRLPQGYDTRLSEGGAPLSGGQRQLLGLARALYGQPRLVVLDEPNANLDTAGDAALMTALAGLKEAGVTTVIVSHRSYALQRADHVLVLEEGAVKRFGPAIRSWLPSSVPHAPLDLPSAEERSHVRQPARRPDGSHLAADPAACRSRDHAGILRRAGRLGCDRTPRGRHHGAGGHRARG
jgi:ABC-type protease/lipase transport system fused ATPase/permease subunit